MYAPVPSRVQPQSESHDRPSERAAGEHSRENGGEAVQRGLAGRDPVEVRGLPRPGEAFPDRPALADRGPGLATTVMPFIIRGVSLLGIASAGTARGQREQVWERLAGAWKPADLDTVRTRECTLDELADLFPGMLAGGSVGRTVVRI